MICNLVYRATISDGIASRYIKNSWVTKNGVQAVAFDLRDWTPPEPFVSFSIAVGRDEGEHFQCALNDLRKRLSRNLKGYITLLDIEICLEEINDEEADIIVFRDERIPHCGLYYLTEDLQKIQEAKTTLAFLANERLYKIPIQTSLE